LKILLLSKAYRGERLIDAESPWQGLVVMAILKAKTVGADAMAGK